MYRAIPNIVSAVSHLVSGTPRISSFASGLSYSISGNLLEPAGRSCNISRRSNTLLIIAGHFCLCIR